MKKEVISPLTTGVSTDIIREAEESKRKLEEMQRRQNNVVLRE